MLHPNQMNQVLTSKSENQPQGTSSKESINYELTQVPFELTQNMSKITHKNQDTLKEHTQNDAYLSSPLDWGLPPAQNLSSNQQTNGKNLNVLNNIATDLSCLEDFNFSSFNQRKSKMEDLGDYSYLYNDVQEGIDETIDSNETVRIINQRIKEMEEKMGF